jgi:hypothetical protein
MAYRRLSERQAEQKRAALERDWMTLLEGIELIKHVDAESKVEVKQSPYQQICYAIEDGELGARWLDQTRRAASSMPLAPDEPYYFEGILWKRKFRHQNGGEIHWGGRRWRKLLLSRKDMQRLFGSAETDNNANKELRQLSKNYRGKKLMHEAISAIYRLAKEQGVRPPNLREISKLAPKWLTKHKGVTAKSSWIEELAANTRYSSRRGKPGVTVAGRARPVSELEI